MVVGSLRRLVLAGAAVLATGAVAVPAQAAAPAPGAWVASQASLHVMRPVGSTAGPTAGAPAAARKDMPSGQGQLTYGQGQVQTAPQLFLDFWGADFSTDKDAAGFSGAQGMNYLQSFFSENAGSAWLSSQTQYCQGIPTGSTITACANNPHAGLPPPVSLGISVWNDTTAPAPSQPGLAAIAAEADAARAHFGIAAKDVNSTFMVVSPPGKSTFSDPNVGNFCAFHDFTTTTIFAYQPWSPDAGASCHTNEVNKTNGPLGQGHFDGLSISGGHEVAEAITDPQPGLVVNNTQTFGWLDAAGFETGDKCSRLQIWPERDILFGADFFAIQPLYSDAGTTCALEGEGETNTTIAHAAGAGQDPNRRDVFIRGSDGAVWQRTTGAGGGPSLWTSLGGSTMSAPAVASWGPGRLDLFIRGADNSLMHKSWTGSAWSGWESLGGGLSAAPVVASWAANRLDIIVRGLDGSVWHKSWAGTAWSGWEPLGGGIIGDPAAVSWSANRLDIFAQGGDTSMWHKSWAGTAWSGWESLGGGFTSGATAASTAAGTLQVFGLGGDHAVWRKEWTGTQWVGWTSLGGSYTLDPNATSPRGTGVVEFFNVGSDGAVYRQVLGI